MGKSVLAMSRDRLEPFAGVREFMEGFVVS